MGRKWKKKGGKNKMGRGTKKEDWASSKQGGDTQEWIKSITTAGNAQMEAYYAAQGLHNHSWTQNGTLEPVTEFSAWQEERLAWRQAMGRVLPASFRIHRDLPVSLQKEVIREFEAVLRECQTAKGDGEEEPITTHDGTGQPAARTLTFLPDNAVAYQLNLDRTVVRKHPRLKPLHEWLKTAMDAGYITRQETVSMIPPAVLDPHPSDTVLDMCAAPGSKTCQLLEHVTGAKGCIVANDANPERAAILTHQLKRVASRNPACLVTACPAQFFPASVTKFTDAGGFEKVLADVPCTGDGTSRKNIDVWKKWTVRNALSLHRLQLSIARRGVELLARNTTSDVYLCYSTCSQSPVEDEAVVAELLRQNSDLELVPLELQGFRTRPGLTKWKVFDDPTLMSRKERVRQAKEKAGEGGLTKEENETSKSEPPATDQETESQKDVLGRDQYQILGMGESDLLEAAKKTGLVLYESFDTVPPASRGRISASVFPPSQPNDMHLERCLRVLPQDNDTGGFFIALLRKKNASSSTLPSKPKRARLEDSSRDESAADVTSMSEMDTDELDPDNKPVAGPMDRNKEVKGAEAFVPLSDELWNPLIEHYGLAESPLFRKDCFMTRVGSEAKNLHYVCPSVKAILDTGIQERIYVMSGSVKAFTRNSMQADSVATHRVAQEAVAFVAPLMTKRKVMVGRDDFDRCFAKEAVALSTMSHDFQVAVRAMAVGSFVVVLGDKRLPDDSGVLALVAWRCRGDNVKVMVSQADLDSIEKRTTFFLGPSPTAQAVPKAEAKSTDSADVGLETADVAK